MPRRPQAPRLVVVVVGVAEMERIVPHPRQRRDESAEAV